MSTDLRWLRATSLAFLGLIPLIAAATIALPIIYWGFGGYNFGDNTLVLAETGPRAGAKILGFLVGLPSTLAWLYALFRLHRVFRRFHRGEYVDRDAALDLRAFSLFTVATVFFDIATSGARRWAQGEHNSAFWTHININSEHLTLIFAAGAFLVVSFVLVEAERYKHETEQYL